MTLILGSCSPSVAVLSADMRLSDGSGRLVDSRTVKLGYVRSHDARMIYAYTGLAKAGVFTAAKWISQAITDEYRPSMPFNNLLLAVRSRAIRDFAVLPALANVVSSHRRLTVVFTGYLYAPTGQSNNYTVQPASAIISNFEDLARGMIYEDAQPTFFLSCYSQSIWHGFFGSTQAIDPKDRDNYVNAVSTGLPPKVVKRIARSTIISAAGSAKSQNTIGEDILHGTLDSDINQDASSLYQSKTGSKIVHGIDMINLNAGVAISGLTITAGETLAGPKQRPNELCDCGSGKKHKRCCGWIR